MWRSPWPEFRFQQMAMHEAHIEINGILLCCHPHCLKTSKDILRSTRYHTLAREQRNYSFFRPKPNLTIPNLECISSFRCASSLPGLHAQIEVYVDQVAGMKVVGKRFPRPGRSGSGIPWWCHICRFIFGCFLVLGDDRLDFVGSFTVHLLYNCSILYILWLQYDNIFIYIWYSNTSLVRLLSIIC